MAGDFRISSIGIEPTFMVRCSATPFSAETSPSPVRPSVPPVVTLILRCIVFAPFIADCRRGVNDEAWTTSPGLGAAVVEDAPVAVLLPPPEQPATANSAEPARTVRSFFISHPPGEVEVRGRRAAVSARGRRAADPP